MFFGIAILIIGFAFLLQNLGLISGNFWDILWPLLIMLLGFSIIFGWWKRDGWRKRKDWHKFGDEMREKFGHHHHEHDEENKEEEQKED
jgi:hypothetical protein